MTLTSPLVVPDLKPAEQAPDEKLVLVGWLTETGEKVERGEPYVQLAIAGVVFELESPDSGLLKRKLVSLGQPVKTGDLLGELLLQQT